MKTTLFIEISEITARVLVYNEVDGDCHYIDITGGYGKKSIPLHIHYLRDGEILIGEDAIVYDQEEGSNFIESILYAKDINIIDYIKVLINRVEELIPELKIITIVLVSDQKVFRTQKLLLEFNSQFKHIDIRTYSVEKAMAGWYKKQKYDSKEVLTTIYLDYKTISIYNLSTHSKSNTVQISNQKIQLDLNAIHEFYIKQLGQLHDDGLSEFTSHQINQLYNSQKSTLHKQLIMNKDVNVYSSVFFPPRKLVLSYALFKEFKNEWYEQLSEEGGISILKQLEFVDKVIISGGYDLISFLNSFQDFDMPQNDYEEYLLLDGAYHYYKSMIKGDELVYKESLEYSIGVFNDKQFYPLIEKQEEFNKRYDIDLILTNNQKEIQLFSKVKESIKPLVTLNISEPTEIQRVLLTIDINDDKEIDEVSYELRRL